MILDLLGQETVFFDIQQRTLSIVRYAFRFRTRRRDRVQFIPGVGADDGPRAGLGIDRRSLTPSLPRRVLPKAGRQLAVHHEIGISANRRCEVRVGAFGEPEMLTRFRRVQRPIHALEDGQPRVMHPHVAFQRTEERRQIAALRQVSRFKPHGRELHRHLLHLLGRGRFVDAIDEVILVVL